MVDFIRDAEITQLINSDGCFALDGGAGNFGNTSSVLGGGIAYNYDTVNGVNWVGRNSTVLGNPLQLIHEYNFANHGGAVGTIVMAGPVGPANFEVQNTYIKVLTACTSGGSATVSVGTKASATTNLLAATAVASLTLSAKFQGIPDFATVADYVLETATFAPVVAIAVAALTAGRIKVWSTGVIAA